MAENRIDQGDGFDLAAKALEHLGMIAQLHRAGWSIGDTALHDASGDRVWVVSGTDGENRILAEGATATQAWSRACDQARSLGMLRR